MQKQVNTLLTEVGKLKSWRKTVSATEVSTNSQIPLITQDMTLDQVGEMLGIDPKELNNPIIRPLLEKIFDKFKSGEINPEQQQEQIGY